MISELCIDVINAFNILRSNLITLKECICTVDKDLPGWFQEPTALQLPYKLSCRERAFALINQLEYLNKQAPREILVGAGLFAASPQTLQAIAELNNAKNDFKEAMLKLKAAKIAPNSEYLTQTFEKLLPQRDPSLATTLGKIGLARIHLKQCYRKIPNLYERPTKVSWTWANTRSIKRVTISEATSLLSKQKIDAGIERQMKLLQGLEASEHLAIVQELAPHLRANIVFPDVEGSKRLMVKGPIPIFYLCNEHADLPEVVPPGLKKGKDHNRAVRRDVKINPEVFLPAIRAHRYIK